MPANFKSSAVATGLEKSVFSPILKKSYAKYCSNYCTKLHSSHLVAMKCSKFPRQGFNSTWTVNFQMFKLYLEKAEEPEIKLPTSAGSSKKEESSRKTTISALLTMPKPLTVWITRNCGKFFKSGNTRPPDLPLDTSVCRSRSNS